MVTWPGRRGVWRVSLLKLCVVFACYFRHLLLHLSFVDGLVAGQDCRRPLFFSWTSLLKPCFVNRCYSCHLLLPHVICCFCCLSCHCRRWPSVLVDALCCPWLSHLHYVLHLWFVGPITVESGSRPLQFLMSKMLPSEQQLLEMRCVVRYCGVKQIRFLAVVHTTIPDLHTTPRIQPFWVCHC